MTGTGSWRPLTSTYANPIRLTKIGRIVDRLRYKPDWHFEFVEDTPTITGTTEPVAIGGLLRIRCRVYDSDNPTYHVEVSHAFPAPADWMIPDERAALAWVESMIVNVDNHERREFLRLDGIRVRPPAHGFGDVYGP